MPYLSLALAAALTAGIAGGVVIDVSTMWVPSLAVALCWVTAVVAFARGWDRAQFASALIATSAAGWILGGSAVDRALHPPLRVLLEQRYPGFAIETGGDARLAEPLMVEGRLRDDATPSDSGATLRIAVDQVWFGPSPESAAGGISVSVGGAMAASAIAQWRAGRVVRAPILLRRPARYLNWGLPDQERAMARRGIALVGTIKSAALVEVVAHGRWWEEAAAAIRAVTRAAMARHVAPRDPQAAAIATALLIGDRAAIDHDVERRLQEAGTYHVIAISGGNIAILAGLVLGGLSWLRVRGRIAALATIVTLAGYAIVASGGASVARATFMATLYLAVRLIDQRTAAANSVALSGGVLLLLNPLAITDVGFWLTFGATSAILIGVSRSRMPSRQWGAAVLRLLISSICAELALAPVAAFAFQRVTVAGLLLNFAAIPCMTLVQLAAMTLVFADLIGAWWLAGWAADLVRLGAFGLVGSTALLDLAPWLTWRTTSPGVLSIASYYAAIAMWFAASRLASPRGRLVARAAMAMTLALFLWIVASPAARVRAHGDGRLRLTMIDVGQGDAILATFPNGRTLVIDTGGVTVKGDFDIGERVVGPVLRARQLLGLDYLAVTHGDPDHLGGARALVRDFGSTEIWWGIAVAHHEPTALLFAEANRVRATWRTLQRGDRLEIGGVEVRVHHPPPPEWERQKVRNNDSLVLELRFGEVSVVLTGDIGREVEEELLPALDLLPIVILKVPHHGSGTSSAIGFVEKLHPAAALIGVGRSNPYGHPVPYVLERYRQTGTAIFRTDQDGEIELSTDGVSISVRTFTGRVWGTATDHHETTKERKDEGKMSKEAAQ